MATPLDVEFLKLASQNGVFDRATAEKCLEIIDLGQKRGQALSAAQVAINLGFLDAKRADALAAMARTQAGTNDDPGAYALEGWKLEAKLGRGPCGATYDAVRLADRKPFVVKVLTRKFAKHPRTLAAVLDEARRAVGFEHPNALPLLGVVAASGRDLLIFERVPTRSLADVLREGPLPTLRATEVAISVARALVASHARGLPHGDVRPAKVLVDEQGLIRLADFGLAHAACLAAGFGQSGVPFGHPEYLAPEVVQERQPRPTAASDIYALGVLLYELCCGRVPHKGATHRDTLRRHFESPLPPPPEEVHVSTALAEVILRLTAKDPRKRPADMKVALHGLEEYRRARLAGHTSDTEGEAQADAKLAPGISQADWSRQSADANSHSGEWTAEQIDRAEPVGPAGFDPDVQDEESFGPRKIAAASNYGSGLREEPAAAPARKLKKRGAARRTKVALLFLALAVSGGLVGAWLYVSFHGTETVKQH